LNGSLQQWSNQYPLIAECIDANHSPEIPKVPLPTQEAMNKRLRDLGLPSRPVRNTLNAPGQQKMVVAPPAVQANQSSQQRGCCPCRGSRKARISPNPENPIAVFECTKGTFKAEIYLDRVPRTASNFIDLAQSGFYNGIHFHRVIPGFMCQFGCPNAKDPRAANAGKGGPQNGTFLNLGTGATEQRSNGGHIEDENISRDTNAAGTLSMAKCGGSQFFLNVAPNTFLDWWTAGDAKHPVFGKITENYDLVLEISKARTEQALKTDRPIEPIMMNSITIYNYTKVR